MNCDSWLPPKNSRTAAMIGRVLISAFGVTVSASCSVIRSRTTRSIRARPIRICIWISSPTVRMRRLPRWSMSSGLPCSLFCRIIVFRISMMSSRVGTRLVRSMSSPSRLLSL